MTYFKNSPKQVPSKHINASDLRTKIDANPDMLIINVLDHQTYIDCHITGSMNIEYQALVETLAGMDKDREIVVYCASNQCNKSNQAYALLQDLGFTHLYEYADGIKDWFKKGFDVSGMCLLKYLHE